MLENRIRVLFGVDPINVTFYMCFDYVRTKTANGLIVVKVFGEASGLCSITLAVILIGAVAILCFVLLQ